MSTLFKEFFCIAVMVVIFRITAGNGRRIRLTLRQWNHIAYRHPAVAGKLHEIEATILRPTYTVLSEGSVVRYYSYLKEENVYLMVAVRLCNGDGFVITAFHTRSLS